MHHPFSSSFRTQHTYSRKICTNLTFLKSRFSSQVISECAAACLTYSLGQLDTNESFNCLIYRCGGTSLDCSVVRVNSGMFSVLASHHERIGGDKLTEVLAKFLAEEFKRFVNENLRERFSYPSWWSWTMISTWGETEATANWFFVWPESFP